MGFAVAMSLAAAVGQTPHRDGRAPALAAVHDDLGRHLARCRRDGTRAALLVARVEDRSDFGSDLEQLLRVRDRSLRTTGGELLLLCDVAAPRSRTLPLNRRAVELRLRELADGRLLCGWADFPADGVRLADLVGRARRAAVAIPEPYAARATPMTVGRRAARTASSR
jgi:hypothetical protein